MARFGFVADDLTGAGDVLAQAHSYGLDAVLAIGDAPLPTNVDVVGIAGPARSLGGIAFDELVRRDLKRIAELDLEVILYKVCSTFDSSPTIGSIGRGLDLLHEQFPKHGSVPVVPAQPRFGRYTAFSHHFAASGDGIFRLDRHPVMSSHPSTPMSEADLRIVLAEQLNGARTLDALHLPVYSDGSFGAVWKNLREKRNTVAFVVDAVDDTHLDQVASALLQNGRHNEPSIVVGSGGIMTALAKSSATTGRRDAGTATATGPVLAVSASASDVTARQIDHATRSGWIEVAVPANLLHDHNEAELFKIEQQVTEALQNNRNTIVHTTRGASDPRFSDSRPVSAQHVGTIIGTLAGRMMSRGLTRDVAVFGGDTSSHALIAMGVSYLRVTDQFVTAGPICSSDDDADVAGCRLLLKGGQVGPIDILQRFASKARRELKP
ncbi:Hrp-dependent type III effector protein [Rhodococcus sp. 06-621-2]|nr:four-carbon acid sugar kinase family protein [Rhodococcus sp. 06-621-2]OZC55554.1 Hrp-dependent type III effector protein [Rhodococcus sp. 06-621-2]